MELHDIGTNLNILQLTCSVCHLNVIYVTVDKEHNKDTPHQPDKYTCTECNQGLNKNIQSDS